MTTHYWQPHHGGIEQVAYEEARHLARFGHQVTVVTSRLKSDPPQETTEEGVQVYRVRAWNFLEHLNVPYPLFMPSLLILLRRLIPAQDVVLVHSYAFMPSVVAAALCRLYQIPLVVSQHNPFVKYPFPWGLIERAAHFLLGRAIFRLADRLIAVSGYTAKYVSSLCPGKSAEVLHNGVDTGRFHPPLSDEHRQSLREHLGLPVDGCLVLTVRRLVHRNGVDILLSAASLLKQEKIYFVVGGSGPQRPLLERLIREKALSNVSLVGSIPAALLADYYRTADLFVLPTRTGEGLGNVLLEAFASGLPVVATTGGGQEEVMAHGANGLLVPPEAPQALADAINTLYQDPLRRRQMGEVAFKRARTFRWEEHARRLVTIFEEAIPSGPQKKARG